MGEPAKDQSAPAEIPQGTVAGNAVKDEGPRLRTGRNRLRRG